MSLQLPQKTIQSRSCSGNSYILHKHKSSWQFTVNLKVTVSYFQTGNPRRKSCSTPKVDILPPSSSSSSFKKLSIFLRIPPPAGWSFAIGFCRSGADSACLCWSGRCVWLEKYSLFGPCPSAGLFTQFQHVERHMSFVCPSLDHCQSLRYDSMLSLLDSP
jgi:hypothetical protein